MLRAGVNYLAGVGPADFKRTTTLRFLSYSFLSAEMRTPLKILLEELITDI